MQRERDGGVGMMLPELSCCWGCEGVAKLFDSWILPRPRVQTHFFIELLSLLPADYDDSGSSRPNERRILRARSLSMS
jgi:hypothetical protein